MKKHKAKKAKSKQKSTMQQKSTTQTKSTFRIHLEYCCPLFLGISQVLKNNMEHTNHYVIKTLLNLGNLATYDFCLAMADMDKLEQRCTLQSLILCFKLDGPNYISQFFTPRLTKYNLRDNGLNVVQPPYNSLVMHNSYLYMIAHMESTTNCHQLLEHLRAISCSPE